MPAALVEERVFMPLILGDHVTTLVDGESDCGRVLMGAQSSQQMRYTPKERT